MTDSQKNPALPSFSEAFQVWVKIALYSFGGPAGQIAVMHKFVVEEKKWLGENRFLHALNYCMLLPGPEAQQLVTYIGWLLHGTRGGIVAGTLFVLPGFIAILLLSLLYALWKEVTFVEGLFYGIKPAVLAIVIGAVIKIGKKALKNEVMIGIAVLAFVAIYFFKVGFPIIVLTAGFIGFLGGKIWENKFLVIKGHADKKEGEAGSADHIVQFQKPTILRTVRTAFFWLVLWLAPILLVTLLFGTEHIFTKQGIFFSQSALVTFGGAYSVLAYISQKAVETYGWLHPGEMLDGLGMAETTPGPLIQVVQFVGFMGAFRHAAPFDPVVAGILASLLVTWVTFLPSFLFIFTGAPYIEYLRGNKSLTTALSAITAAVVGVILNLGVWFSLQTMFGQVGALKWGPLHLPLPVWNTFDVGSIFITLVAVFLFFKLKWNMLKMLATCALIGLVIKILS